MKVLGKDKIVETYRFPFSEALSFSILIWTIWGLVEAFFWQRAWPFFDPNAVRVHHFIYLSAFLIYVGVASVVAALTYSGTKWILFTMNMDGNIRFRGITYSLILGTFFLTAIPFVYNEHLSRSLLPQAAIYAILGVIIIIAVGSLLLLYKKSADETFRLRRSGTTMMSVLVLSAVMAFVSFPLFSSDNEKEPPTLDLKTSTYKLMAMHYIFDATPQK